MSETKPKSDDYRIDLTDIRGVGPATVEKLEKERITSVRELHLIRRRGKATHHNLEDRGVGSDTLSHLRAVGKAVHYSGSDRVEAKHLTGPITDGAEFSSSFVDISAPDESPDESDESPDLPDYSTDEIQDALDRIHGEYEEGYGEQVSFEGDLGRFLSESETFDPSDHQLPTGIIQSVMRYRHDADRVVAQGDYDKDHGAVLVQFAETLE